MKKCLIVSGGEFFQAQKFLWQEADLIIACDKGFEYSRKLGINPHVIIGDFDSASFLPDEKNFSKETEIIRLPKDKDDTDTMAGVKYAIKKGFDDFTFICAFGGRFDHLLGNLQVMEYALNHGKSPVRLYSESDEVYIIKDSEIELPYRPGWSLSVFSLCDKAEGVYEEGTKWTLKDAVMQRNEPYGVSNEWKGEKALIGVKKGVLAVILSRLEK